jgi:molybdenum cofactor synthesis domain-containing protein
VAGGPNEDGPAANRAQVEIRRAVADGENTIGVGEDIRKGEKVIAKGAMLGPAEIGALAAIGLLSVPVAVRPVIGLISTGDEVIQPSQSPSPGQVRDVNTYSLGALISRAGGIPKSYGIIPDQLSALKTAATAALAECDALLLTAGSSASARDLTADVVNEQASAVVQAQHAAGKPTVSASAMARLSSLPEARFVSSYLSWCHHPATAEAVPFASIIRLRLTAAPPIRGGEEDWWQCVSWRRFRRCKRSDVVLPNRFEDELDLRLVGGWHVADQLMRPGFLLAIGRCLYSNCTGGSA